MTEAPAPSHEARATAQASAERGHFIYITLGFVLTIGAALIVMSPIRWPWNWLLFAAFAVGMVRAFAHSSRFQDWLTKLKSQFEKTP